MTTKYRRDFWRVNVVVMATEIETNKANVLITGGSEGIGRGLAARYLAAGSKVLVTGRTPEKLESAARELPGLMTVVPLCQHD